MMCYDPNENHNAEGQIPFHPQNIPQYSCPLCGDNLEIIFSDCADFVKRTIFVGTDALTLHCFFLDGLISGADTAETVLRPLTDEMRFGSASSEAEIFDLALGGGIYGATVRPCDCMDDAVNAMLNGFVLLVFDGLERALAFDARSNARRGVDEPVSEQSLKGARDSFTETLRINTALVRRHLRNSALKFRATTLGRKSNTRVELAWVDGVTNPKLLEIIQNRLDALETDGLLTSSSIEAILSDTPLSPFPQYMLTERPDRFGMNLLEGRVGLLVDGLPLGWLLPATLPQQLRVPEDVSKHSFIASTLTLLRHFSLFVAILFPALYVAVALYHQEMIPVRLLLSVIESKQAVPFSTATEIAGMLIAFELLQEAGLRLPPSVGETVSIIGALIVGQSAVEARVISPIAVIVVATAGIASFTIPNQDLGQALRLTRFALVLTAIGAGMYGIAAGCIVLLWHLCSLNSCGVAYLSPMADGGLRDYLRAVTVAPRHRDKFRDPRLNTPDRRRER